MKVAAELDNLYVVLDVLRDFAKRQRIDAEKISQLELTTEEMFVNIVHYAYPDTRGNIEIHYTLTDDHTFVIEFSDWGIPFDPLSVPAPDLAAYVKNQTIGGLGIFLVRKLMDDVQYRRENGKNMLTLVMNLFSAAA